MKIIREHVIVKVRNIFNEETQYKGVDGQKIIMSTLFNPERHIRDYGIVVSTPEELYQYPLDQEHIGAPGYHEYRPFEWKRTDDIQLEVQEGDKVYFHYNCLLPDTGSHQYNHWHMFSKKEDDGEMWHYFRVKYDLIFCAVRYEPTNEAVKPMDLLLFEDKLSKLTIPNEEGINETIYHITDRFGADQTYRKKVIMIGSYLFVEPDMETWRDISIPVAETINGKILLNPDGSRRMKPEDQWLVMKQAPGDKYLRGWVRHSGAPLKGDNKVANDGDYVYFQRHTNTSMNFEGSRYFRLRQRYVIGVDKSKTKVYENV